MFRRVTSRVLRRAHPMLPEQFAPTSEVNNYSRSGKLYDGLFDCDDETSEQGYNSDAMRKIAVATVVGAACIITYKAACAKWMNEERELYEIMDENQLKSAERRKEVYKEVVADFLESGRQPHGHFNYKIE